MIKNWKITITFLLVSILVSFISGNVKLDNLSLAEIIGEVLGSLLILFLIPLLLTYLMKLFAKWMKNDLKGNGFVTTYAVFWGIISLFILYGSYTSKQYSSGNNNDSGYLYNPKNSAYSVVFSRKPTITPTTVPFGSKNVNGEIAEVDLADFEIFERVEFYTLDKSSINLFDNNSIAKFLTEYSRYNGLSYPEIKFNQEENNKYAELRANKMTTLSNGKQKTLTFVARVFIKGETLFVTYVGAISEDFPTPDIVKFWSSIKSN